MRDDDRATGVARQKSFQPADTENVEVVGRLVEQQDVRTAEQDLRQHHAQLEAARQGRKRRAVHGHGNPKAHEHFASARLEGVAIVRGDQVF